MVSKPTLVLAAQLAFPPISRANQPSFLYAKYGSMGVFFSFASFSWFFILEFASDWAVGVVDYQKHARLYALA
jgi:hypothetical protein